MSAYIQRSYVSTFLSSGQVTSLLSYGEKTDTSEQNAKLDLLISGSSSVIDSFLAPAGYNLPLDSVPESIKKACFYLVVNDLYASAQQPIPDTFADQVSQQYAFLNLLKDKKLILDGLVQDIDSGTGANSFDYNTADGTSTNARVFDKKKLYGNFF